MAFAYGTLITIPNGTTAIEQLMPGDTASAWTANGAVPKAVVFSNGTPGGRSSASAIHLRFGDDTLIVTQDQPIVLAGNKVKNAAQLQRGDRLVNVDRGEVVLIAIDSTMYNGVLHAIAIDKLDNTGDHFIIANGFICGDYVMEMMSPPPDNSHHMSFPGEEEYKTID
jgi:hypothetical protein